MEMTGEYRIPAPRGKVWDMLNDADVLRVCIPGCEMLEESVDGEGFKARVTTKIGPVKATFNGAVTLSDIVAPERYTIAGEGKGGVAGFASGSADVTLAEDGGVTVLTYAAKAKVGGKLAQLGSRLIDSTARKLADQFFAAFAEKAGGESAEAEAVQPAPAAPEADDLAHRAADALSGGIHAVEETVSHVAHDVSEAAHHAEEELEKRAAAGMLGGPFVWGLLALIAVIVVLWIAS